MACFDAHVNYESARPARIHGQWIMVDGSQIEAAQNFAAGPRELDRQGKLELVLMDRELRSCSPDSSVLRLGRIDHRP